jgi:hypothetical protein
VGISLKSLSEGCCEYLESLGCINLDKEKEDKTMSSVDKVLECHDKYIFIEEKSFLLEYFNLAAKKINISFCPKDGIIEDEFLEDISQLQKETKKELMNKAFADKLLSISDKVKDTTLILFEKANSKEKLKNARMIYLYCHSGTPIDTLLSLTFNKQKHKEKIIACKDLENYLKKQGCA